jgi:hypothetical protein
MSTGFAVLNVAIVLEGKNQQMACVVGTMQVFEPENNLFTSIVALYFHWDLREDHPQKLRFNAGVV